VSDTDLSPSWHRLVRRLVGADDTGVFPGRHTSRTEIAAETPIFHDLTIGRKAVVHREPEPVNRIPTPRADPLIEFRRDPLTAPIPVHAYTEPAVSLVPQPRRRLAESGASVVPAMTLVTSSGAHAMPEQTRGGRHHRPVPVSHLAQRG
jgi:hypothetical protein